MGLGTVELVMELEDAFELSIPDEIAERMLTPGKVRDFIIGELKARSPALSNAICESARRFHILRADFQATFDVPRQRIRPSTRVADVIPEGSARANWGEFSRRQRLPAPPRSVFPTRRFPAGDATLRSLLEQARPGSFYNSCGEVDTELVWTTVRKIVGEQAGVSPNEVHRDTHFINDLNLD